MNESPSVYQKFRYNNRNGSDLLKVQRLLRQIHGPLLFLEAQRDLFWDSKVSGWTTKNNINFFSIFIGDIYIYGVVRPAEEIAALSQ